MQQRIFQSAAAGGPVSYHVYTPPQYGDDPQARFPVLYWLHGTGGGLGGVAPLTALFDAAIRQDRIPPMIIVFPNGLQQSMWMDSADGRILAESMLIHDLIPHIDASLRTIGGREGRMIEGFSMGGYGAARLGFRHSHLFAAVSVLAGGPLDLDFEGPRASGNPGERARVLNTVYGGDLALFRAESPWMLAEDNADALRGAIRMRIATGDRDFTYALNEAFSRHLDSLDLAHDFLTAPGVGHNAGALIRALDDRHWAFYGEVFAEAGSAE